MDFKMPDVSPRASIKFVAARLRPCGIWPPRHRRDASSIVHRTHYAGAQVPKVDAPSFKMPDAPKMDTPKFGKCLRRNQPASYVSYVYVASMASVARNLISTQTFPNSTRPPRRRWICHRSPRVTVHKTNYRGEPDSLVDLNRLLRWTSRCRT